MTTALPSLVKLSVPLVTLSFCESVFLTFFKPQPKSNCVSFFPSPIDGHRFITDICFFQPLRILRSNLYFSNVRNRDQIRIWDPGVNDGDSLDCVMDLWLHPFGYCCIGISKLNVALVKYWRHNMIYIGQICSLRNASTMFRLESIVMIGLQEINHVIDDAHVTLLVDVVEETATTLAVMLQSHNQKLSAMTNQNHRLLGVVDDMVGRSVWSNKGLWSFLVSFRVLLKSSKKLFSKDATVEITTTFNLFVIMLEKITKSRYFRKTLVRKLWYHYVYISELCLDTSGLQFRFAKRKFSYKMLHANRNREKSNMKLDNNRSYDRLASKTTLRKVSSISLLLYFS